MSNLSVQLTRSGTACTIKIVVQPGRESEAFCFYKPSDLATTPFKLSNTVNPVDPIVYPVPCTGATGQAPLLVYLWHYGPYVSIYIPSTSILSSMKSTEYKTYLPYIFDESSTTSRNFNFSSGSNTNAMVIYDSGYPQESRVNVRDYSRLFGLVN